MKECAGVDGRDSEVPTNRTRIVNVDPDFLMADENRMLAQVPGSMGRFGNRTLDLFDSGEKFLVPGKKIARRRPDRIRTHKMRKFKGDDFVDIWKSGQQFALHFAPVNR